MLSVMTVFKLPLHFLISLLLLIHTASGFQSDVGCLAGNQSAQTSSPGSYRMGALLSTTISTNELPPAVKEQYANKSILITGASRGLGRSLAYSLSTCDPSLIVLSGRDEKSLQQVKNDCIQINKSASGRMKVECIAADLADKASVHALAVSALQLSHIDILINNGGISSRSSFVETKIDVDELLLQVNFLSGATLAKSLVPGMLELGGGRIVWISSVQGKREFPLDIVQL